MEWLKFLEIANRVCKEKGVIYEFECPICKGVAKASKSTYNGHLHAQCKKCDMTIMGYRIRLERINIMEDEIKVGDKFRGKVNGAIFEVTEIDERNKVIHYKCNDEQHWYGLDAFKQCLLEKVKE